MKKIFITVTILFSLACSLSGGSNDSVADAGTDQKTTDNAKTPSVDEGNKWTFPLDTYPESLVRDFYSGQNSTLTVFFEFSGLGVKTSYNLGTKIKSLRGVNIDDWNLNLMQLAFEKGIGINLDDFIVALQIAASGKDFSQQSDTPILDVVLRDKLIADIKYAASLSKDDKTGLRFMSHALIAMGRQSPKPYDLLSQNLTGQEKLNAVQLGLISQIIAAELFVAAKQFKPLPLNTNSYLTNFNFAPTEVKHPCTMTDAEGLLMDAVAGGSGATLGGVVFFKGVLERLTELKFIKEIGLERFNSIALTANVVLNYVKLAWSIAAFKAEMKLNPRLLVRTKNKIPGGEGTIGGHFRLDIGNAQIANCVRPALNAAGLDFSLPQDGPLVGSRVEWNILTRVGAPNDVIQTNSGDVLHKETDATGYSEIQLQGKPQPNDLSGLKLVEFLKIVPVMASLNLKNKNPKQDAIDLFSGLGGLSALWSLPVEILNRKPVIFNGVYNVPVKDWKILEGNLLRVHGTYSKVFISDAHSNTGRADAGVKNVTDEIEMSFEISTNNHGKLQAEVLSMDDKDTTYTNDFPHEFIAGEGCTGTQTPIGTIEIFKLKKYDVRAYSSPGAPARDIPPEKRLEFNAKGISHTRAWQYTTSHTSCRLQNKSEQQSDERLSLKIDLLQIQSIGDIVTIDQRSNGTGWLFTATIEE